MRTGEFKGFVLKIEMMLRRGGDGGGQAKAGVRRKSTGFARPRSATSPPVSLTLPLRLTSLHAEASARGLGVIATRLA